MNSKTKIILKVVVPVAILVQLTTIIFLLNKDKAFSCRAIKSYMVCKQVKLK
jgi:hypothetical protein